MTKGLHVPSEIGKLRKVCLHRPGDELLNLPPDELERLLFDDVPFLEVAQQEHDTFAQILRDQGVEVLYLENLVAEVFDQVPGARAEFTDQYIAEAGIRGQHMPQIVREKLDSIEDNLEFVKKTMAGMTKSEIDMPLTASTTLDSLVNSESESDLIIDPMPNLYFTRDPFAVIGEGVNLNRMYSVTRNRETLYGKYIFKYHPDYKDVSLYFRRDCQFHTEGGDVLNINEKTLAVGISQRTQAAAIDIMAQNIFWNSDSSTTGNWFWSAKYTLLFPNSFSTIFPLRCRPLKPLLLGELRQDPHHVGLFHLFMQVIEYGLGVEWLVLLVDVLQNHVIALLFCQLLFRSLL